MTPLAKLLQASIDTIPETPATPPAAPPATTEFTDLELVNLVRLIDRDRDLIREVKVGLQAVRDCESTAKYHGNIDRQLYWSAKARRMEAVLASAEAKS